MCEHSTNPAPTDNRRLKTISISQAVGCILAHDLTEIKKDEFKGVAFRKGHIITESDISHLRRLGKENLFVLSISDDEMHEDDAAIEIGNIIKGDGVAVQGNPKEGKINFVAARDGILKINTEALLEFNLLGEIMCATLHNHTLVKKSQIIAGARAIPLVIKKDLLKKARKTVNHLCNGRGVIEVRELKKFKAGVVITGNEVFYGRVKDSFAEVIKDKLSKFKGEIIDLFYAPDNTDYIEKRLLDLLSAGADLLIVTGGMSVDPDDVSRFAIKRITGREVTYGSPVLPGAMFLVAYTVNGTANMYKTENCYKTPDSSLIPILGIPACGMYHKTTIFDIILPRILAGEIIGRKELAEYGHGGLCLNCNDCKYPICPFGK